MFQGLSQGEGVEWLSRVIASQAPLAAITGDAGVGKSTAAAAAALRLADCGYLVIRAAPPFGGPLELLSLLADNLGLPATRRVVPADIAAVLHDRLPPPSVAGSAVLLIDGAEQLPPTTLSCLWLLHRLVNLGLPRLKIVFVGRPSLWQQFVGPDLVDFQAEIASRFALEPLQSHEAVPYMRYRLQSAGATTPKKFSRRLTEGIIALAQGRPWRLDAIVLSILEQQPVAALVTASTIRKAIVRTIAAELATTSFIAYYPKSLEVRRLLFSGGMAAAVVGLVALPLLLQNAVPSRNVLASVKAKQSEPQLALISAAPLAPVLPYPSVTAPRPLIHSASTVAARASTQDAVSPAAATPKDVARTPVVAIRNWSAAPTRSPDMALPSMAMPSIDVLYEATNSSNATRAKALVMELRQRGFLVDDPVATRRKHHATTVEYFFTEDRDRAQQLARGLGGAVDQQRLDGVLHSSLLPPPGTIHIVLADDANASVQTP